MYIYQYFIHHAYKHLIIIHDTHAFLYNVMRLYNNATVSMMRLVTQLQFHSMQLATQGL